MKSTPSLPTFPICLLSQSMFVHDLSRSREIWPIFIVPRGAMGTLPSLIRVVDWTTADAVDEILSKFRGTNHESRISEGDEWRASKPVSISPKVNLLMRNRNDLVRIKTRGDPVVAFGRTSVKWISGSTIKDHIITLDSFPSSFLLDFITHRFTEHRCIVRIQVWKKISLVFSHTHTYTQ